MATLEELLGIPAPIRELSGGTPIAFDPNVPVQAQQGQAGAPTVPAPTDIIIENLLQPVTAEPLNKRQRIAGLISDLLAAGAAPAYGPRPSVQRRLQDRQQREADRQTAANRQRAALLMRKQEREERREERKEDRAFDLDLFQRRMDAAATEAEKERIWREGMAEANRASNERIAGIRASGSGTSPREEAQAIKARDASMQGFIALKSSLAEELKTKTPDQIRREFKDNLDVMTFSGLTDEDRNVMMLLWMRQIEPVLREAESAALRPEPQRPRFTDLPITGGEPLNLVEMFMNAPVNFMERLREFEFPGTQIPNPDRRER